jgi:chorismate synthase
METDNGMSRELNKTKRTKQTKALRAINAWDKLGELIGAYVQASIDNSWAGGGDPADVELLKLRADLSRAELNAHLVKMQRESE